MIGDRAAARLRYRIARSRRARPPAAPLGKTQLQDLRLLFDSISAGLLVTDARGRILLVNQRFFELFGIPPARIETVEELGSRLVERVPDSSELFRTLSLPLDDIPGRESSEWQLGPGDRIIRRLAAPIRDCQGTAIGRVDVYTDVTEEHFVQLQLIQSEKLRALGEVASGVVHDFNNLLASILGRTEMLLLDERDDRQREALLTIRQAALDGASTVRRIQEHVRVRQTQDFAPTSVREILELAAQITQPAWKDRAQRSGRTITLELDVEEGLLVLGSASELREVIVNMILNAVDALPSGGTITLSARRHVDQVAIGITDTGVGMDEETRRHVFDPFFTTKGPDGTGLGLSIAYGIICRHGGTVTVGSAEEKGTTFTICLPLQPTRCTDELKVDAPETLEPCRALLLDDQPQVLATIAAMLHGDRHEVDACADPAEALALLASRPYDVFITDLGMPDVNGWEVAARAKAIRPAVPVILVTGWGSELDLATVKTRGVDLLLPKPYGLRDLRNALKTVMQPPPQPIRRGLVVDDQRRFADALAQRLQLEGLETSIATSATEAVQLLEDGPFDAAFVDLRLPDGEGTELAAAIKRASAGTFVILMTGFATAVDDDMLATASVDAVLPKPWKGQELKDILDRAAVFQAKAHLAS